jgi:hypothetical protein
MTAPAGRARTGIVHVHSNYSRDGKDSLPALRAACLARGIGFVGLTDHAEDLNELRWVEYVAECAALSDDQLQLIPGLEFRFSGYTGLHLLALGLARWIMPSTPEAFIDEARRSARFTISAHPILFHYRMPEVVALGIDAIEVWNATYNTRFLPDPRAIRLLHDAQRRHPELLGIAGLDQHDSTNDRETRIILTEESADPLGAMRVGLYENAGRMMRFDSAVTMTPRTLRLLGAARWAFDRVERTQDRIVRSIRRARR